jgi:hypothetical protein
VTNIENLRSLLKNIVSLNKSFVQLTTNVLVYLPVDHLGRFVVFQNWPSRGYCCVDWHMNHLFEPTQPGRLDYGRTSGMLVRSPRFQPKGAGVIFEWNDPTMVIDLCEQIEEAIVPLFNATSNLEDSVSFVGSYPQNRLSLWEPWVTLTHIALGNIDLAQTAWLDKRNLYNKENMRNLDARFVIHNQWCRLTEPLMSGDRAALARLLHEWESTHIIGTKLAPYWRSKPFPLEES